MKKRWISTTLLLVVCATLLMLALVCARVYEVMRQRTDAQLRELAGVLSLSMETAQDAQAFLARAGSEAGGIRLSRMDKSGAVLYDSRVRDTGQMENHAERKEFVQALQTGEGSDERLSVSLGEDTYYYARRLSDGTVLRLARSQRSLFSELTDILPSLLLIFALVLALSVFLAGRMVRRFLRPLETLDLEHPEDCETYEELTPMLAKIAGQNRRIEEQWKANLETAQKVTAITENMAEGLMMLSGEGRILSMNRSAEELLGADASACLGQHYLTLYRDLGLHDTIEKALCGERAEGRMTRHERIYQLLVNPVQPEEGPQGVVVLLLDVTERALAEQNRREFSANVSHELKTPLTTIAGYAEMMQAGISDLRDTQTLAGKISGEARHLLTLIEDIIALSRLDESTAPAAPERVNLYPVAQDVVARLGNLAERHQVRLSLEGEDAEVWGAPPVLEEMIRNLVDNAIRYSRPGGEVRVRTGPCAQGVCLRVQDNGIGIDPAHHGRIFERFYRVDKSHCRTTGGTGLGLSIVKHGAKIHGARIDLDSAVGQGTRVTLTFPDAGEGPRQ